MTFLNPRSSTYYPRPSTFFPRPSTFYPRPSTLDKNLHSLFGGQRREKMLDAVQNIRHVVFIFVLLSLPEEEKNLAARLPEVRPISTFHMKQLEYLENVQRIGPMF